MKTVFEIANKHSSVNNVNSVKFYGYMLLILDIEMHVDVHSLHTLVNKRPLMQNIHLYGD